jgi:hypothetical protein
VNVIFFVAVKGIVRVASSNSIANTDELKVAVAKQTTTFLKKVLVKFIKIKNKVY